MKLTSIKKGVLAGNLPAPVFFSLIGKGVSSEEEITQPWGYFLALCRLFSSLMVDCTAGEKIMRYAGLNEAGARRACRRVGGQSVDRLLRLGSSSGKGRQTLRGLERAGGAIFCKNVIKCK